MSKQTYFLTDWLNDPQFKWLQQVPSNNKSARCSLCNKVFQLSNMGRRAVLSHMNGEKHKRSVSSSNSSASLKCFLKSGNLSSDMNSNDTTPDTTIHYESAPKSCDINSNLSVSQPPNNVNSPQSELSNNSKTPRGMQYFIMNDNVTRAEILWAIESVITHTSMRTAARDVSLMSLMFPDSEIANKMQLQKDKIGYLITHGISSFFQNELLKKLNSCEFFVVGFDESLNKVAQKQQMDLNIRFWDSSENEVKTRYLTSVFLGRSTAADLLEAFKTGLKTLDCKKILQVSMDGPNVNHKFLKDLRAELKTEPSDKSILDMGSCGLHTLHCAFKSAMHVTGWDIVPFLRALYNLFKDSPARRALFTSITGSNLFPKKFCAVRWIENVSVVHRAIEILPNMKTFVEEITRTGKISTHSFSIVTSHMNDELLAAKLEFFKSLASDIEPFLRQYQSDSPMAPFLFNDLSHHIKTQMERIVVSDAMEEKCVTKIDFEKNLLPAKSVKLGIATKSAIRKANEGRKVADKTIILFRDDVRRGLLKFVKNLLEKSPLHFKLTRAVSCFDPSVAQCEKLAKLRMESLLTILLENNWTTSLNVDVVLREYVSLCKSSQVIEELKTYSRDKRLDNFWYPLMTGEEYSNVRKVWILVSTLSHGNANIERGFSVNSECVVENMREELLVARRCVYDTITSIGGIKNLVIEKPLIHAARNSYSRYKEHMAAKEKKTMDSAATLKRKASQQIKELEEKKARILQAAQKQAELLTKEMKRIQQI